MISAKTGLNVEDVLETIVEKVPAPYGDGDASLKALIFDSYYDSYKGVVCYVRIKMVLLKPGTKIKFMATNKVYDVTEVGVFTPKLMPINGFSAGDVGYITASIKNVA